MFLECRSVCATIVYNVYEKILSQINLILNVHSKKLNTLWIVIIRIELRYQQWKYLCEYGYFVFSTVDSSKTTTRPMEIS